MLLISTSAFLANVKPHGHVAKMAIQTGGVVGWLLNDFLTGQIKSFFSSLFFFLLMVVSFAMVAKISIQSLCKIATVLIGRFFGGFFHFLKQALESRRKSRRMKQVKEKYSEEEANHPKEKPLSREPILKIDKKQIRQPSRIPEETYLFTEFDQAAEKREMYTPPPLTYLDAPTQKSQIDIDELDEKKQELSQRLQEFRINGEIIEYTPGPVITTFEFVPDAGVKVKDVSSLTEDLALVVKAQYVRIERILGKKAIGIEIPNNKRETHPFA